MPDVSNLREGQQLPPTFDHVAIVDGDRVQQPGTLQRDPRTFPQNIEREHRQISQSMLDRASDKFAIHALQADQIQARQLLPFDSGRKIARIQCFHASHGVFLGTQDAISNAIFQAVALDVTGIPSNISPNCWYVPPGSLIGTPVVPVLPPIFEYTSKQPLFVCSGQPATQVYVQCIVERFDSGTPIN